MMKKRILTACLAVCLMLLTAGLAETRQEILAGFGGLLTEDFINVLRVETNTTGHEQSLRIYFEEDTFLGGTTGYEEPWLARGGCVAETYADLDGDGTNEYLLIRVEAILHQEEDYSYTDETWYATVYEAEGGGWRRACDIPLMLPREGSRFLQLTDRYGRSELMAGWSGYWDGGSGGVRAALYTWDGSEAWVDLLLEANIGEDSFIAYGPIDPAVQEDVMGALAGARWEPDELGRLGLIDGVNCRISRLPDEGADLGMVFDVDEEGKKVTLREGIADSFDAIAPQAMAYGVTIACIPTREEESGWLYESYDLSIKGSGLTLLTAGEGFEPGAQAYLDLRAHFEEDPLIDREGGAPAGFTFITPEPFVTAIPTAPPTAVPTAVPTPVPTEAPTPAPERVSNVGPVTASASSFRVNRDRSISVDPSCAADGSFSTAWNSNRNSGGEWLRLDAAGGALYQVAGLRIANGYWKSDKVFRENAAVASCDIYCDGRYVTTAYLTKSRELQTVRFPQTVSCRSVTLEVRSTHGGSEYSDICVTEIELLGPNDGVLAPWALPDWGRSVEALENSLAYGQSLAKGSYGPAVAGLQLLLRDGFGIPGVEADGDFGSGTQKAVAVLGQWMQQRLGPACLPMAYGIADRAYWTNMLACMDGGAYVPEGGAYIPEESAFVPEEGGEEAFE